MSEFGVDFSVFWLLELSRVGLLLSVFLLLLFSSLLEVLVFDLPLVELLFIVEDNDWLISFTWVVKFWCSIFRLFMLLSIDDWSAIRLLNVDLIEFTSFTNLMRVGSISLCLLFFNDSMSFFMLVCAFI